VLIFYNCPKELGYQICNLQKQKKPKKWISLNKIYLSEIKDKEFCLSEWNESNVNKYIISAPTLDGVQKWHLELQNSRQSVLSSSMLIVVDSFASRIAFHCAKFSTKVERNSRTLPNVIFSGRLFNCRLLRECCSYLQQSLEEKFSSSAALYFISVLFLRFFCPALINPVQYELVPFGTFFNQDG
jgi:hypothetical protein